MSENGDGLSGGAEAPGASAFECPGCGETIEVVVGPVAQWVACPGCGGPLVVPGADGSVEVPEEGRAGEDRSGDELDALRIRHVVVQRRAAARSRTYALLGAGVCVIGAAKLVLMAYHEVRGGQGWHGRQAAYVVVAIAAVMAAWYFLGRAAYWAREGRGEGIPEPEAPPDFSTLGDGSQHARDLEDVR